MSSPKGWFSSPTQVYWTCEALLRGRAINHRMETREVRGWRLAAIIHRLKTEFSWPICVDYRGSENIAHYWLAPGTDPTQLRYPPSAASLKKGAAK